MTVPIIIAPARHILMKIAIVCFILLLFSSSAQAAKGNDGEIKQAVVNFFYCFRQKKYESAYDSFSKELKANIPYYKFVLKAKDIKKAWIKKVIIYDSSGKLGKLRIDVRLELIYKQKLYNALYTGTCDIVKEKTGWKVSSVELKAKEAVPVESIDFTQ